MSDSIISREQFVEIINECLEEWTAKSEFNLNTDASPWQSDAVRWEKALDYARTYFFRRIAKKHAGYLGDNLSQAVDDLAYIFMKALINLRRNKSLHPENHYNYSYIVATTENALREEEKKPWVRQKGQEISIEGPVDTPEGPDVPIEIKGADMLSAALKVFQELNQDREEVASYITFNILNELKGIHGSEFEVSNEGELLRFLDNHFISFCFMQELNQPFNIRDHIDKEYASLGEIRRSRYGYYYKIPNGQTPQRDYSHFMADTAVATEIDSNPAVSDTLCYKNMEQSVMRSYGWAQYSESWNVSDKRKRLFNELRQLLIDKVF